MTVLCVADPRCSTAAVSAEQLLVVAVQPVANTINAQEFEVMRISRVVSCFAPLSGAPPIWLMIANDTVGKNNVAVILAAQMAGKGLSIHLDAPAATCGTYPSWAPIGGVRHVRIIG